MTFNIGKPSDGVTDGQRIQRLYLYLNQMADKLNYALNNMDEQNLTRTFLASLTNGGDSDQQSTKGLKTEQVDEMIQSAVAELKPFDSDNAGFTVTVKGEGDNVTAVSCSAEDIQSVVDVLQMNADDGAKAVANVQSDSVLILLHALDTRATVKKAAQKQHDTLFSADGNSNESVGGNATTDSITEGADT